MAVWNEDAASLNLQGAVPRLQDYDVSPHVAFMNENPLQKLPEYFDPWWQIGTRIPELVQDGTLRDEVNKMPYLDFRQLKNESEWRLAHVVLCAITQSYVWMCGEENIPRSIPQCIAVPFFEISELLGITPSCCQFNGVLDNWRLIDPKGPVIAENMTPIIELVGGDDQVWFFMVSGQVEIDCAPALCGLVQAQQAVKDLDVDSYIEALDKVEKAIRKMKASLGKMRERCRPWVFYNVLRPFVAGWDSPAFKHKGWKGLIYEGVSPEPLCYGGGSAAQSATSPCLDAALGINHQQAEASFSKNSKALHVYNACLQGLADYRSFHLTIVTEYIIIQSQRKDADGKYPRQAALGTGGTGFMQFLKALRSSVTNAFYRVDEGTEIN